MNPAQPEETASPPGGADAAPASPEELRADIERTREQLGDTVEALVAKTDVKARVQEQAAASLQRGSSAARGAAGSAARQAGKMAGRLETAAARAVPPTATDPDRARRTAQQAATAVAALTAAGGVITAWLSRRRRRR